MLRDDAFLLDILLAAQQAVRFVKDIEWDTFRQSELHQNAVIRSLEVIGEAARLVSDQTRKQHPEIPWKSMLGMRNRLIHEYFRVELRTVWDTVQNELPDLAKQLQALIPPEE